MSRLHRANFPADPPADTGWLELVRWHVGSLSYGLVQIIVHDGRVTQIEKTERVRLDDRARTVTQANEPVAGATTIDA
jgi:hypothetical protein